MLIIQLSNEKTGWLGILTMVCYNPYIYNWAGYTVKQPFGPFFFLGPTDNLVLDIAGFTFDLLQFLWYQKSVEISSATKNKPFVGKNQNLKRKK